MCDTDTIIRITCVGGRENRKRKIMIITYEKYK